VVTRARRRGELGAGSVLAVAMMGLLVTVTVAAAGLVGVVATHRIAQSAADLAALAGASALQDGADACDRAAAVAERNRATLTGCEVSGWDVAVVVTADTARLPGGMLDLSARGRAGPAISAPGP
jgi:secretion/DNA translocation related TadE-like protein